MSIATADAFCLPLFCLLLLSCAQSDPAQSDTSGAPSRTVIAAAGTTLEEIPGTFVLTRVAGLRFSPDGSVIGVVTADGAFGLYGAANGKLIASLRCGLELSESLVHNLAPGDRDSIELVTIDSIKHRFQVTGEELREIMPTDIRDVAFLSRDTIALLAHICAPAVRVGSRVRHQGYSSWGQ